MLGGDSGGCSESPDLDLEKNVDGNITANGVLGGNEKQVPKKLKAFSFPQRGNELR